MDNHSGVGVIDKTALVLTALEAGPTNLAGLVAATGLPRPTAHRLALALEHHRLVARDTNGRFALGPRLGELAGAVGEDRLTACAQPILTELRKQTGESAQLYRRDGDKRICVAASEKSSGLRDTVPVGTVLTMQAGSAAQVFLAADDLDHIGQTLARARFSTTVLSQVRRRGWAQSVGEREPGVASVSAPVRGPGGTVIAALSVSGPIERLTRNPGKAFHKPVVAAADQLSRTVRLAQAAQ
jgi:DNA-binding IclR family transcriptional regulator